LIVIDPAAKAPRPELADLFDSYIADAEKRHAMEAKEQAQLIKREFLELVKVTYVENITRDRILDFDVALRNSGLEERTIINKRQRLQAMLTFAGVDSKIFPPKPKYEKKLTTIYTPIQLAAIFSVAAPNQAMPCKLALKLGLRDQEIQYGEFTDIIWDESVYRVRIKPKYEFTVKDYEQRDIPIPSDLLEELRIWKDAHLNQNLIVPTKSGRPNAKLLKMVKRLARRAEIECGLCSNCVEGVKGE
jgi:integrase